MRVSLLTPLVKPGGTQHISISYVEGALVQTSVTYPGKRALSLFNMTDAHGRLRLAVTAPQRVTLRHGRASGSVVVQAIAGPWRRLTVPTRVTQAGANKRVTFTSAPHTYVRAIITSPHKQARTLFGVTDSSGRVTLTIAGSPRRARVGVAVWTLVGKRHAQIRKALPISDMIVGLVSGPIAHCSHIQTIRVSYRPSVPLRLLMIFPGHAPLTLSVRTDRHGNAMQPVRVSYVKSINPVSVTVKAIDARPHVRRLEQITASVRLPKECTM